jgi:hypothetical protein
MISNTVFDIACLNADLLIRFPDGRAFDLSRIQTVIDREDSKGACRSLGRRCGQRKEPFCGVPSALMSASTPIRSSFERLSCIL